MPRLATHSNFTGLFLNPERNCLGRVTVMATSPQDALGRVLALGAEIYSCAEEEITVLSVVAGESRTYFLNTNLEAGNVEF